MKIKEKNPKYGEDEAEKNLSILLLPGGGAWTGKTHPERGSKGCRCNAKGFSGSQKDEKKKEGGKMG